MEKNRKQAGYTRLLEKSFIISLVLLCTLFYNYQHFDVPKPDQEADLDISIPFCPPKIMSIPPKPKPPLPLIPVEAPEDEFLREQPVDLLLLQSHWLLAKAKPPQISEPDTFLYICVSEKPVLVNSVVPEYPALARASCIEGMVIVSVLVGTDGCVDEVKLLKSIPMLDESALTAAAKFKFKPGMQQDKKVKVWMNVPFRFSLRACKS